MTGKKHHLFTSQNKFPRKEPFMEEIS